MANRGTQAQPDVAPYGGHTPGGDLTLPEAPRLSRVWQFPLLLISFGLFGYAGYRFVDPKPGPTVDQRLESAAALLRKDQADAATELLRSLASADEKTLSTEQRGTLNLYLARAVEQVQKARNLDLPENHQRIVEYTRLAERNGVKLDAAAHRRLAESYQALGRTADALAAYRQAIAANPDGAQAVRRKFIELLIAWGETGEAEAEIKRYLADQWLPRQERSWAVGEQSRLLTDRLMFTQARDLLGEAIKTEKDPQQLGQFHYRLGYCHWRLNEPAEAERYLRLAREQLGVSNPQDAEAALLLGRLLAKRGRHAEAISFFQAVIASHPDAPAAVPAKLGRGLSRAEAGEVDAGLTDLAAAVADIQAKPARNVHKAEALTAVRQAAETLADRDNLTAALELMALEQTLEPAPPAEFFARLSRVYERRGTQLAKAWSGQPEGPGRVKKWQQWRDALTRSADAAVAHSRGLTLDDDAGYGEALWRGIDLYDRAGALPQAIGALELFIAERPTDPLAPDALLRLGRAYHAAGQFDKAISAFQRNQFRHGQSLAAQKSGVPLAKAYKAKGPTAYGKAEAALRATLESPLITPDAEEFREALYELAQLYYHTGRFEEALQRLEELTNRYPRDERLGQLQFLMADSYRKSAQLLKAEPKPTTAPAVAAAATDASTAAQQVATRAEIAAARQDRLAKARRLYEQAIEQYAAVPPKTDLDALYHKLAHFYRADCVYDAGAYADAIKLYDAAALRYQDDPSALAAYVQIVNAYSALGKAEDAKAANERAKWLLKRMPPEAFTEARLTMPQKSWDDWVTWSKAAGLWSDGTGGISAAQPTNAPNPQPR